MTTYTPIERRIIDGAATFWTTETGDDGITCRIRCLSESDATAGRSVKYDARCASCYLGHAHSQLYHRWQLSRVLTALCTCGHAESCHASLPCCHVNGCGCERFTLDAYIDAETPAARGEQATTPIKVAGDWI